MKKKTELQVGQIWGVPPLEKTLEVRTIHFIGCDFIDGAGQSLGSPAVDYYDVGDRRKPTDSKAFRSWITRKKAVLIGHYDFKTGVAKGGKK